MSSKRYTDEFHRAGSSPPFKQPVCSHAAHRGAPYVRVMALAAARLRHLAGTHWGSKRYLCMDELIKRDTLTSVAA